MLPTAATQSAGKGLGWRQILSHPPPSEGDDDEAVFAMEQEFAAELGRRLQVLVSHGKVTSLGSHKVFEGLELGELNSHLSGMDIDGLHAHRCLLSLNNIAHMAPSAVASAMAEHGTVEARVGWIFPPPSIAWPLPFSPPSC